MLFKDLKQGYPVYMLIKGDELKVSTGKVVNVSQPYYHAAAPNQAPMQATSQRVTDVTIENGGVTKTYSIPETLSVTYSDGIVLSTDKDGIVRDVEAIKEQSVEVVNSIERHKKIVSECDKILEDWNPRLAETRKQDLRISGLEEKVENIGKMLSNFISDYKTSKDL